MFFKNKRNTIDDNSFVITTLVSHDRVKMLSHCLKSLLWSIEISPKIIIISDGSLTVLDKLQLKNTFSAEIISRKETDNLISRKFSRYKNFMKFRSNIYSPITKLKFDAIFSTEFKRLIYIDSDLLFFKKSKEVKKWIANNENDFLHLEHDSSLLESYKREDIDRSFRAMFSKKYFPLTSPFFNSGLLCIPNKDLLDINLLDKVFTVFNELEYSQSFTSEETAMSVLFKNTGKDKKLSGAKYLCPARDAEYFIASKRDKVAIHYIYETKKFFFKDSKFISFNINPFFYEKFF